MAHAAKSPVTLSGWTQRFARKAAEIYPSTDPSHDLLHVERVVAMATRLAEAEGGDLNVVIPAAWFHDFVTVPKSDPRRAQASRQSAEAATAWLAAEGYPPEYLPAISHAIAAHSFSAGIPCETLEAKIVQDADRLDAIGAIGIARMFTVTGLLGRAFYDAADPEALDRPLDDRTYGIDHFKVKLFGLVDTMHTGTAQEEGRQRLAWMRDFYDRLVAECRPAGGLKPGR
jgi:uncharacterized protein